MVGAFCFLFHFLGLGIALQRLGRSHRGHGGVHLGSRSRPSKSCQNHRATEEPEELHEQPTSKRRRMPRGQTRDEASRSAARPRVTRSRDRAVPDEPQREKANLIERRSNASRLALLGVHRRSMRPATNQVLRLGRRASHQRARSRRQVQRSGGRRWPRPEPAHGTTAGVRAGRVGVPRRDWAIAATRPGPEGSGEAKEVKPPPSER